MNRFIPISLFLGIVAVGITSSCTPSQMAEINKIDPPVSHKYCPMMCAATQVHPRGACCWDGDTANDGYVCNNYEDKSPSVCEWMSPVTPPMGKNESTPHPLPSSGRE